jgi:hydroxymethylglutaryl-CoA reductase (NADPH)
MVSSFGIHLVPCLLTPVLLNLLNLCTLPFRPRQSSDSWTNPFDLAAQPSQAALSLISDNISLRYPAVRTIFLSVIPPQIFQSVSVPSATEGLFERSGLIVGGFLEGWTNRVGDPVMSKWIVIVLCVSMGLNAWLLNAASRGAMQLGPSIAANLSEATSPTVDEEPRSISAPILTKHAVDRAAPVFTVEDELSDDEGNLVQQNNGRQRIRSLSDCMQILAEGHPSDLLDEEVIALTIEKKIPLYALEKSLQNLERAVKIRRAVVCEHPYSLTY